MQSTADRGERKFASQKSFEVRADAEFNVNENEVIA